MKKVMYISFARIYPIANIKAIFHYNYISNAFQYISNKMQHYTVCLYLETAPHVSGGTSAHHQERIQLYLQHLVFVRPLLLPAAIAARCNFTQFVYIWKLLYMFRVVPPPIIRSAYKCIYNIWYLSDRYCYLLL
jgi:hypothetical protein